jgi:hypothetical protein
MKIDFETSIVNLEFYRQIIIKNDDLYRECELAYQLISLYKGLQEYFSGKEESVEYINEKQETVMRLVTGMIHDRSIELD